MLAFRFAQSVLRSRFQAILFALIFAGLPYLNWISGVVVGLVTLRKGKMEGFLILLWSLLPGLGMAAYTKLWMPFLLGTVFSSFLLWLLAIILRYRGNWVWVLYMTAVIGMAAVGIFHLVIPDVPGWWLKHFTDYVQQLEQSVTQQISQADLQKVFELLSQVATGLKIALFSMLALVELFFARSLEYLLIKPGGMVREFAKIRLHIVASILLIVCFVLGKSSSQLFLDFLPVLTLPFIVAGVSLVHSLLMTRQRAATWLMIFYLLLIFAVMFLQFLLVIFVGLAMADSVINFRRFQKR